MKNEIIRAVSQKNFYNYLGFYDGIIFEDGKFVRMTDDYVNDVEIIYSECLNDGLIIVSDNVLYLSDYNYSHNQKKAIERYFNHNEINNSTIHIRYFNGENYISNKFINKKDVDYGKLCYGRQLSMFEMCENVEVIRNDNESLIDHFLTEERYIVKSFDKIFDELVNVIIADCKKFYYETFDINSKEEQKIIDITDFCYKYQTDQKTHRHTIWIEPTNKHVDSLGHVEIGWHVLMIRPTFIKNVSTRLGCARLSDSFIDNQQMHDLYKSVDPVIISVNLFHFKDLDSNETRFIIKKNLRHELCHVSGMLGNDEFNPLMKPKAMLGKFNITETADENVINLYNDFVKSICYNFSIFEEQAFLNETYEFIKNLSDVQITTIAYNAKTRTGVLDELIKITADSNHYSTMVWFREYIQNIDRNDHKEVTKLFLTAFYFNKFDIVKIKQKSCTMNNIIMIANLDVNDEVYYKTLKGFEHDIFSIKDKLLKYMKPYIQEHVKKLREVLLTAFYERTDELNIMQTNKGKR